jgi:hypothetical protein
LWETKAAELEALTLKTAKKSKALKRQRKAPRKKKKLSQV